MMKDMSKTARFFKFLYKYGLVSSSGFLYWTLIQTIPMLIYIILFVLKMYKDPFSKYQIKQNYYYLLNWELIKNSIFLRSCNCTFWNHSSNFLEFWSCQYITVFNHQKCSESYPNQGIEFSFLRMDDYINNCIYGHMECNACRPINCSRLFSVLYNFGHINMVSVQHRFWIMRYGDRSDYKLYYTSIYTRENKWWHQEYYDDIRQIMFICWTSPLCYTCNKYFENYIGNIWDNKCPPMQRIPIHILGCQLFLHDDNGCAHNYVLLFSFTQVSESIQRNGFWLKVIYVNVYYV